MTDALKAFIPRPNLHAVAQGLGVSVDQVSADLAAITYASVITVSSDVATNRIEIEVDGWNNG